MTRVLRGGLTGAAVAVGGFHLQILWARLADGSVLDPFVATRWLGSIGLGVLFAAFHRRGISLVRGRRALILWLLVALLHGIAWVPGVAPEAPGVLPAEIFLVATPLVGVAALGWIGALALRRAGASRRGDSKRRPLRRGRAFLPAPVLLLASGPRAPPRAAA